MNQVFSSGSKVAALVLAGALSAVCWSQGSSSSSSSSSSTHKKSTTSHSTTSKTTHSTSHSTTHKTTTHSKSKRRPLSAKQKAKSHKLQQAFVASSQLRPMGQQLATMRSPAAYAGVSAYAHSHTGEASAAAYIALGHAYLLDR
ncbi:MAG TPA: hypothetical protein VKH40_07035, partial [Alloacidobacterium sp.]|nr:hypothetical protein [Alloacidobacterium sp.]